jgi:phospholipid/cholesterol/gamma-HCH transport system substrate-binding protein
MAIKVSNETKVGALTAIAITLLILGFNFLKGNNPMKKSQYLFAKFNSIEGLVTANPVMCNGLVIGNVYKLEPADELMSSILVTIRITEDVLIPDDSKAVIKGNLLSTPVIEILKGESVSYLNKGDTIITSESSGFLGEVLEQLGPTQVKLNSALGHLDTLLTNTNNIMDANTQAHLRRTMANLDNVTSNLAQTTSDINKLLKQQNNAITNAMANLEASSNSLKEGTKNLPGISQNLESVTKQLSETDFKKLVANLDGTVASLNKTIANVNSTDGSLGALMNDRKLYDNLTSTVNSLNLLMQDLRLNPKRYVNISVFGKKDKSGPLMRPLEEDSITQEQFKKQ